MKLRFHVPTQTYGFLEIEGTEKDLAKMEVLYNRYAENKLDFGKGVFKEYVTFTGEKILYNPETHSYSDLKGHELYGASYFKSLNTNPFDKEKMLPMVEKKYKVPKKIIEEMWDANSKISTTFGTALHLAMEQWFKHKGNGTEKNYHIPKHPFLKLVVDSFPLKDEAIIPEVMVSDVKRKMAGQIDALLQTGENKFIIIDYKTDANIDKNLHGHFLQLSYYASILQAFGYEIEKLQVWNYTDQWVAYDGGVLDVNQYKPFKK